MSAWGFRYTTNMVWHKDGEFGVGYYFRMQHELLLLGRARHAPTHFVNKAISSVLNAPRTAHSEKPVIVHEIIERATEGPYVELFGRRAVEGWTVVGNQLPTKGSRAATSCCLTRSPNRNSPAGEPAFVAGMPEREEIARQQTSAARAPARAVRPAYARVRRKAQLRGSRSAAPCPYPTLRAPEAQRPVAEIAVPRFVSH